MALALWALQQALTVTVGRVITIMGKSPVTVGILLETVGVIVTVGVMLSVMEAVSLVLLAAVTVAVAPVTVGLGLTEDLDAMFQVSVGVWTVTVDIQVTVVVRATVDSVTVGLVTVVLSIVNVSPLPLAWARHVSILITMALKVPALGPGNTTVTVISAGLMLPRTSTTTLPNTSISYSMSLSGGALLAPAHRTTAIPLAGMGLGTVTASPMRVAAVLAAITPTSLKARDRGAVGL